MKKIKHGELKSHESRVEFLGHKDLGEGKTRSDLDNVQRGECLQTCPCASSTGPGRPTPTSPAVLQGLEEDLGYLVGDCLLAAAFLSYMGPFLTNSRDEIVNQIWIRKVRQGCALAGPGRPSGQRSWGLGLRGRRSAETRSELSRLVVFMTTCLETSCTDGSQKRKYKLVVATL